MNSKESLPPLQGRFFLLSFHCEVHPDPKYQIVDFAQAISQRTEEPNAKLQELLNLLDSELTLLFDLSIRSIQFAFDLDDLTKMEGLVELQGFRNGISSLFRKNPGPLCIAWPFPLPFEEDHCFNSLWIRNSYPKNRNPSRRFRNETPGEHVICTPQNNKHWKLSILPSSLLPALLKESSKIRRARHILDEKGDPPINTTELCRLLGHISSLPTLQDLQENEENELKNPLCFPFWANEQRAQLLQHDNSFLNCVDNCRDCLQKKIWDILYHWYHDIFLPENCSQKIIMADGSVQLIKSRKKGLVILGQRNTGKTKFFQSFCGIHTKRIIHVKNRFNTKQWIHLPDAWLILIDDFHFREETDLQMFKALLAAEATIIEGKWCTLPYSGGLPCVILCNDLKFFTYLQTSIWFKNECIFLDIQDCFLGPPQAQIVHDEFIEEIPITKKLCSSKSDDTTGLNFALGLGE